MELHCCVICGPGLVRTDNQDNLYVNGVYREDVTDNSVCKYADITDDSGLYAVSDGMGGEKYGELAALEAVSSMGSIDLSAGSQGMARYLIERNAAICDMMKEKSGVRIGATFVGLCINGKRADIINIGDSRLYMLRGRTLKQLSLDHAAVRQMLELGAITEEAARKHPDRHMLTQHLGIFPSEMIIEPYTASTDVEAGDIFLLCSDGLTDMLDDAEIKALLETKSSLGEKTAALYIKALKNGGKDNISVLLVQAAS